MLKNGDRERYQNARTMVQVTEEINNIMIQVEGPEVSVKCTGVKRGKVHCFSKRTTNTR